MIKHPTSPRVQLLTFDGGALTCPLDYNVADITREDVLHDSNIQPADGIEIVEEDGEEPLVYMQIGQIEIDDTTFGVCTGSHLSGYAVCVDGHPSETVYTRDNIHTDEDREAERAMIAAGYWHS